MNAKLALHAIIDFEVYCMHLFASSAVFGIISGGSGGLGSRSRGRGLRGEGRTKC